MLLGDILIKNGSITETQLTLALQEQKKSPNEKIGDIIVRLGFTTKSEIEKAFNNS